MPKNIETEHIDRMFPFEFFDELTPKMSEYVINNTVFLLKDRLVGTDAQRKQFYHQNQDTGAIDTLNKNNIIDVEPFGPVLILSTVVRTEDVDIILKGSKEKDQLPLTLLIAQYYDSTDQPVFATDVDESTIEKIPEILWDDPRLMLSVLTIGQTDDDPSQVGIIKIPESIEAKILEDAPPEEE